MKVESKQIKSVTIQNLENDLSSIEIELSCLKYFCWKTTAEYKPSNPKLETVLNDYKAFILKQMRKAPRFSIGPSFWFCILSLVSASIYLER